MAMSVMHAMLGNAAVAAVLAVLALGGRYTCRSPAVRHLAWLMVLLKLVTPPLFTIPLSVLPASWSGPPADPAPLNSSIWYAPSSASATQNIPSRGVVSDPAWWQLDW